MTTKTVGQVFAVFEHMTTVTSRTEKRIMISTLCEDQKAKSIVRDIYHLVHNPYSCYFLTWKDGSILEQRPPIQITGGGVPYQDAKYPSDPWKLFKKMLEDFSKGEGRGQVAQLIFEEFLSLQIPEHQKWYIRILNKDLKIGFKQFELIFSDKYDQVPQFKVQLAQEYKDPKKVTFPCMVEPKLDGVRGLFIFDGDKAQALSRSGRPLNNCDHILEQLRRVFPESFIVVDGELLVMQDNQDETGSFSNTVGVLHSKGKSKEKATLWIFDILPLSEFQVQFCSESLVYRRSALENKTTSIDTQEHLRLVPSAYVRNETEIEKAYVDYLQQGFEGIIIKDPDAVYYYGRNKDWLKYKPVYTVDLCIVGSIEGEGKAAGKLGSFMVSGQIEINGENILIEANVGGGYTDQEREDFWDRRDELLGQTIEVRYGDVSSDQQKRHSLRFPRFVRLRPDKALAETANEVAS